MIKSIVEAADNNNFLAQGVRFKIVRSDFDQHQTSDREIVILKDQSGHRALKKQTGTGGNFGLGMAQSS